jgi:hypothetical protein
MKYIYSIVLTYIIIQNSFSQNNFKNLQGIWEFTPPTFDYDSTWLLFKNNKSLEITYWNETKKSSIYGKPYTYYGFWDTSYFGGVSKPKQISELKPKGRYILFYDKLIKDLNEENKIGYDTLGNLYRPTRGCDWGFINDGNEIEFNFGPQPDTYKRVTKIPDYVLISLKKNNEHWQRYLEFLGEKEGSIHVQKSFIYSQPNKQTKMYLLKDDEVEIIEKKEDWLHIRYYGKKVVEGWIKKSDVE